MSIQQQNKLLTLVSRPKRRGAKCSKDCLYLSVLSDSRCFCNLFRRQLKVSGKYKYIDYRAYKGCLYYGK